MCANDEKKFNFSHHDKMRNVKTINVK